MLKSKNLIRNRYRMVGFFLVCGLLAPIAPAQQIPAELISYPDLILHNGKVITCDDQETVVSAVAIRDGKFLATGNDSRILRLAGPVTEKLDLQGKSVVPGFIDTHLHQAFVGQLSKLGDSGRISFRDRESALDEIKSLVEASPPGKWIALRAPRVPPFFTVTRHDLDPITPNNPVILITVGADVLANTLAFEAADMPLDTPGIVKDEQGVPTGQLVGWAAGVVLYETRPWPPLRDLIPRQKEMFSKMNSEGLTTIIARAEGLSITVFRDLWLKKELTARVRVAHELLRMNPSGEKFLRRMGNLSNFGDEWFKIIGATVMPVDGSDGEGAALSSQPKIRQMDQDAFGFFGQNKWLGYGATHMGPDDWEKAGEEVKQNTEWHNVILANRYGWNITSVHSAGDESTRITLMAYEAANEEKPLEGRWAIDHQPMQNAETIALFKKLNVIPSFYYFTAGGRRVQNMTYLYGADRAAQMVPLKTFIREGILPTAEADTNQYPFFSPMYNLENFVTRMDPQSESNDRIIGAAEKIDRLQALYMYTKWAARYSNDEHWLGTIEPGKLADLAVLDGDFFGVPEEQIFEQLPVVMTIVGGKLVYETENKVPSNVAEQRRRF